MTNEEIEEKEFNMLLAEKRHKEMISIFSDIKKLLSQPSQRQSDLDGKMNQFEELIKSLKTPVTVKSPDVKVQVNQDELAKSISEMSKDLLIELKKFNERPVPVRFDIEQNRFGNLSAVNIVYKK